MSDHKYAYGWLGHIIASENETKSDDSDNLVTVSQDTFDRLVSDHQDCEIDARIHTEQLGVINIDDVYFLACGTGFSEGWEVYGTVFRLAESGARNSEATTAKDQAYHAAMLEVYGIKLPPSKLMIGCSSEH